MQEAKLPSPSHLALSAITAVKYVVQRYEIAVTGYAVPFG